MGDVTSNMTIAVMMNYLSRYEVEYSWSKPIRDLVLQQQQQRQKACVCSLFSYRTLDIPWYYRLQQRVWSWDMQIHGDRGIYTENKSKQTKKIVDGR